MKFYVMTLLTTLSVLLFVSSCASTRVLVKDCQDLQGIGDQKNCELIRKL